MADLKPRVERASDPGDQMVTAERSMFGTRLPRPTGVGRHLIVVIVVAAVALGLAIAFAERSTDAPADAPSGAATPAPRQAPG